MKAMVLERVSDLSENKQPLVLRDLPAPIPAEGEILLQVTACGVCHTELDEIEGRTPPVVFPVIPGHQVIGRIVEIGGQDAGFKVGDRVGVAWIHSACGNCQFCRRGLENLCSDFKATGRDVNGGYAQFMKIKAGFVFDIPAGFSDLQAAPLLCAGAIGYRSLNLTGVQNGQKIGLTGFGASGHLVLKMAAFIFPESDVYVFARSEKERSFALELGACWAGDTTEQPPHRLSAIIDTTPVWKPVVEALNCLEPGGRLVINAIRKESIDQEYLYQLDYSRHLWLEKEIKSVANITRKDVKEFLKLAADIPILPEVEEYGLKDANRALLELKEGKIRGAKVLKIE